MFIWFVYTTPSLNNVINIRVARAIKIILTDSTTNISQRIEIALRFADIAIIIDTYAQSICACRTIIIICLTF